MRADRGDWTAGQRAGAAARSGMRNSVQNQAAANPGADRNEKERLELPAGAEHRFTETSGARVGLHPRWGQR